MTVGEPTQNGKLATILSGLIMWFPKVNTTLLKAIFTTIPYSLIKLMVHRSTSKGRTIIFTTISSKL